MANRAHLLSTTDAFLSIENETFTDERHELPGEELVGRVSEKQIK